MSKKKKPQQAQPKREVAALETQPAVSKTEVPATSLFDNFWIWAAILVAVTVSVYLPSLSNDFMIFDDDRAIRYNNVIKSPTLRGIFLSNNLGMYAPVTWLGYSLVYAIAGENATAFHTFSLLLHVGCVVSVFYLLRLLQPNREIAFFAALLFALHPIQVEATCWIAGQSTLTFSFFYLLGLITYAHWQRGGKAVFYGLTLLMFLLSVLAKSAAVTFPLVLLALDWHKNGRLTFRDILAKWPYLLISFLLGLYTLSTREAEGHSLDVFAGGLNLLDRFLMVSHSLLFYPFKLLFPLHQSIFYPIEKTNGVWSFDYYLAPLAVAGLGWAIWKFAPKMREIGLGAAWYLLPLLVMLPYVKVGTFEMRSDRYVYVSSAGFLFLVVWLAQRLPVMARRGILTVAAISFAYLAYQHSKVWKNEVAVFQDCVDKYPNTPLCNCNLAYGELLNFKFEDCIRHYTRTLELDPTYVESYNGRGQAYLQLNKIPEAYSDFDNAIKAGIVTPKLFLNRGKCLVMLNRPQEAIPDLNRSLELEPKSHEAYFFRALALEKTGSPDKALPDYSSALQLNPRYAEAMYSRGTLHYNAGRFNEAIADYSAALSIASAQMQPTILNNRANALIQLGKLDDALNDANQALSLNPNYTFGYRTRAMIYTRLGQPDKAQADLQRAQ
jgi:tetratricopeptide (TPR) repeat protein